MAEPKQIVVPTKKNGIDILTRRYLKADISGLDSRGYTEPTGSEEEENSHSKMQWMLREIGHKLRQEVYIASNDSNRIFKKEKIIKGCVLSSDLGAHLHGADKKYIPLIDVVWLSSSAEYLTPTYAFEVEHTTQIYTGILRLCDLANANPSTKITLVVVVPDKRVGDVINQLNRPSFAFLPKDLVIYYMTESDLEELYKVVSKFNEGLSIDIVKSSLKHVEKVKAKFKLFED